MVGITTTIAVVGGLLAAICRPSRGYMVYLAVLLLYPSYLTLNVGGANITASRVVVFVLLIKCLSDRMVRTRFVWSRLDSYVTAFVAVQVVIRLIIEPTGDIFVNRCGFLMDTWFAYITARLSIGSYPDFVSLVRAVSVLLIPLAILGVIEATKGWQPFLGLTELCPWKPELRLTEARGGFNRAIGPFGHPIMFGACFALFMPLIYALRHQKGGWRQWAYISSLVVIFGGMSSVSSGPWIMLIVSAVCLILENYKKLVIPLIGFLIFSCVVIAIISNRPFYHVIAAYANPIGGTGWHRAKLIDCAINSFGEWFLLGFQGRDTGWGQFLGSDVADITNQFILAGVEYGMLGIITLSAVLVITILELKKAYRLIPGKSFRSFAWSLGVIIVTLVVAFMSVSFFGQMMTLFYCLLGLAGALVGFASSQKMPAVTRPAISCGRYSDQQNI